MARIKKNKSITPFEPGEPLFEIFIELDEVAMIDELRYMIKKMLDLSDDVVDNPYEIDKEFFEKVYKEGLISR